MAFLDADFRSYVVLAWMFCNALLVAVILKSGGVQRLSVKKQEVEQGAASNTVRVYLMVVLWSVAGLSGFKFVGAMWYLIKRIVSISLEIDEPSTNIGYSSSVDKWNRGLDLESRIGTSLVEYVI